MLTIVASIAFGIAITTANAANPPRVTASNGAFVSVRCRITRKNANPAKPARTAPLDCFSVPTRKLKHPRRITSGTLSAPFRFVITKQAPVASATIRKSGKKLCA